MNILPEHFFFWPCHLVGIHDGQFHLLVSQLLVLVNYFEHFILRGVQLSEVASQHLVLDIQGMRRQFLALWFALVLRTCVNLPMINDYRDMILCFITNENSCLYSMKYTLNEVYSCRKSHLLPIFHWNRAAILILYTIWIWYFSWIGVETHLFFLFSLHALRHFDVAEDNQHVLLLLNFFHGGYHVWPCSLEVMRDESVEFGGDGLVHFVPLKQENITRKGQDQQGADKIYAIPSWWGYWV